MPRPLVAAAIALCAQLWLLGAARAAPAARCQAVRVGQRVLVQVTLHDLLDRDLTRLLRSGLEGHVTVSAALIRSRAAWFDDTLASRAQHQVLTYQRRRGFVFDGRTDVADPARIDTGTLSLGVGLRSAGGLYVEVAVKLRVVTVSSLRRTASWLTGGAGAGVVSDRVIRMVVSDLTRSAGASCRVVDR